MQPLGKNGKSFYMLEYSTKRVSSIRFKSPIEGHLAHKGSCEVNLLSAAILKNTLNMKYWSPNLLCLDAAEIGQLHKIMTI